MRFVRTYPVIVWLCMMLTMYGEPAQSAVKTEGVIPRLSGPITIDGRLNEPDWRKAWRVTQNAFTVWRANKTTQPADEFVLRMLHDGTNLYVSLASYDRFVEPAARAENADGIYALSLLDHDGHPHHYRLRWSTPTAEAGGELQNTKDFAARLRGPYAEPRRQGGGYVLELKIPIKTLGLLQAHKIALNVIINDHDDNPGGRYDDPATVFYRFAYGGFNNDEAKDYRWLQLGR